MGGFRRSSSIPRSRLQRLGGDKRHDAVSDRPYWVNLFTRAVVWSRPEVHASLVEGVNSSRSIDRRNRNDAQNAEIEAWHVQGNPPPPPTAKERREAKERAAQEAVHAGMKGQSRYQGKNVKGLHSEERGWESRGERGVGEEKGSVWLGVHFLCP